MDNLPAQCTTITAAELAAALGVNASGVRRHCRAGHLPGAVKIGRDWHLPARYADPGVYEAAIGKRGLGSANRQEVS